MGKFLTVKTLGEYIDQVISTQTDVGLRFLRRDEEIFVDLKSEIYHDKLFQGLKDVSASSDLPQDAGFIDIHFNDPIGIEVSGFSQSLNIGHDVEERNVTNQHVSALLDALRVLGKKLILVDVEKK